MSKRLHHQMTYDAPLPRVVDMLADPRFREAVCEYQHVLRADVEIERSGDTMTVTVEQVQPTERIPAFAKKFVGNTIDIVQREEWSAPDTAALRVTIPGKPGHMEGTISLVETDGTTVVIHDSAPLVGRIQGIRDGGSPCTSI